MRKIVVLSGLALVAAAAVALWPSASYSASKGRTASSPPGKSTVSPGGKGAAKYTKKPDYLELKLSTPTISPVHKRKTRVRHQGLPVMQQMDRSSPK